MGSKMNVSVGDEILLVTPDTTWQKSQRMTAIVNKVGRKYAYVKYNGWDCRFDLVTGCSDYFGATAYLSEQHYEKKLLHDAEHNRLAERISKLLPCYRVLVNLSEDAVTTLHDTLDKLGL